MIAEQAIPPAAIAGALAPIKAYLRIEHDLEDDLLLSLAAVAIRLGEGFCGRVLIARTMGETLPACSDWRRLAATPVRAIVAVRGVPAEGADFPLPADAYAIDIDANGDGWVRVSNPGAAGRIAVTVDAGLAADWASLAEPIRQGAIRLVGYLHANRDGAEDAPPAAVAALWRPFRRMRLG